MKAAPKPCKIDIKTWNHAQSAGQCETERVETSTINQIYNMIHRKSNVQ